MRIASISWRIFIAPIWAVKALSVRPASRMAVITTPNSRSIENADQFDGEDRGAEIAQMRRADEGDDHADEEGEKATIGSALSPASSITATIDVQRSLQGCGEQADGS